ncbi:hypothetical protein EV182_002247 [Spiromyces aspiralis]|uniref:Uncharacterized protein n=1 Tax=Spiromyces aspiralis TaxID=68401 RepID=A0ACC1HGT3_9FUNG|nr:hypothetical protein EV182_002247 [Spiromyces aspiralis]
MPSEQATMFADFESGTALIILWRQRHVANSARTLSNKMSLGYPSTMHLSSEQSAHEAQEKEITWFLEGELATRVDEAKHMLTEILKLIDSTDSRDFDTPFHSQLRFEGKAPNIDLSVVLPKYHGDKPWSVQLQSGRSIVIKELIEDCLHELDLAKRSIEPSNPLERIPLPKCDPEAFWPNLPDNVVFEYALRDSRMVLVLSLIRYASHSRQTGLLHSLTRRNSGSHTVLYNDKPVQVRSKVVLEAPFDTPAVVRKYLDEVIATLTFLYSQLDALRANR